MEKFEYYLSKFPLKSLDPKCWKLTCGKNNWIRIILLGFSQIPYYSHMVRFQLYSDLYGLLGIFFILGRKINKLLKLNIIGSSKFFLSGKY